MKTNWQIKKLNEICDKGSSNISQNQLTKEEGIYPIYGAGGFIKNISFFQQDKDYISIIKDGAGIGRVSLLPAQSSVIGTLQYIIPKENINLKFLYYIMNSFDFSKYKNGATIPHIYFKEYSNEQFVIPPLSEQKRIVKVLDETFEKIEKAKENAEKNLQNSKELFESYLQSVFTNPNKDWDKKTLKEITSILGDGLHGTPKYTENGEYYFINGNNLDKGKIIFKENTKRVSVDQFNLYKKNLNDRTVLVSINGTLCNVAFYNNEKIILGKSACYFNLLEGIDKNFIKYIILSPYFVKYAFKEATGATIKNVSLKTMREFIIYLPKLTEQKAVVKKLNELSNQTKKLEVIYRQKLADLEELKKSVLKKAFSGEL